jgi:hypothetical protein
MEGRLEAVGLRLEAGEGDGMDEMDGMDGVDGVDGGRGWEEGKVWRVAMFLTSVAQRRENRTALTK